jgi:hypothetical protein
VIDQCVLVYLRCTQAIEVTDSQGVGTGVFRFDSAGAKGALAILAQYFPKETLPKIATKEFDLEGWKRRMLAWGVDLSDHTDAERDAMGELGANGGDIRDLRDAAAVIAKLTKRGVSLDKINEVVARTYGTDVKTERQKARDERIAASEVAEREQAAEREAATLSRSKQAIEPVSTNDSRSHNGVAANGHLLNS